MKSACCHVNCSSQMGGLHPEVGVQGACVFNDHMVAIRLCSLVQSTGFSAP